MGREGESSSENVVSKRSESERGTKYTYFTTGRKEKERRNEAGLVSGGLSLTSPSSRTADSMLQYVVGTCRFLELFLFLSSFPFCVVLWMAPSYGSGADATLGGGCHYRCDSFCSRRAVSLNSNKIQHILSFAMVEMVEIQCNYHDDQKTYPQERRHCSYCCLLSPFPFLPVTGCSTHFLTARRSDSLSSTKSPK